MTTASPASPATRRNPAPVQNAPSAGQARKATAWSDPTTSAG